MPNKGCVHKLAPRCLHSHRALQLQPGVHKVHHKFINKQYHFMTSSDRFPVLVSSAVKSNFTNWCCQHLSQRALNALTVQASTTELPVISKLAVPNIYNACRKICFRKSLCLWCELFRWKCRILSRTFPCLSSNIGLRNSTLLSLREDRLCVCP